MSHHPNDHDPREVARGAIALLVLLAVIYVLFVVAAQVMTP